MTTYPPGQFVDEAGRAHVPFSTGTTAAPTDGTWAVGNLAVTTTGTVYACTVAGTPGTWAAVSGSGGGFSLARTAVKTSNYSAAVNDLIPCDTTSAGFTVTLPTAPADKSLIAVKLVTLGGTNAVTIACGGSDVFNKTSGATTRTLNILNESVLLEYTASGAIWTTVAGDTPLSSLDSRFSAVIAAYAAPIASPTLTGVATSPVWSTTGATGAVTATRYVGGTASVAPTTGTFVTGDFVIAADGKVWICTTGGSPGTWVQSGSATYQTLANIDTDSAMAANSDTKYASQKATKTALAAKAPTASPTFTGTVTVPDATANTAAAALRQAMFAAVAVPLVSTYYVRSPAQLGTTTGTPTLNLMTCVPIVFTNAGTLVSIAAANNANTATAVCRLGLYADNGSGQPGALIDDYGTVDFSTGPSTKTIVISRAVTAMTLYWLAAVEQTAATSAKVASNGSGSGLTPGYTTPLNSTIPTQCWTQASVSAGLPNPAVVTATGTSSIIVEVKI